jgi:transcriptional regulator with XRE-family HTH domain
MTDTANERAPTLSERAAEEIRAVMGRRRITGAALARQLSVSDAWISYRLNGKQPIDLNDLERIASILGVHPVELLGLRRGLAREDTVRYQHPADEAAPSGQLVAAGSPSVRSLSRSATAATSSSPTTLRPVRLDLLDAPAA